MSIQILVSKDRETLSLCHINARSLMSIDTETQSYLKFDEIESRLVNELEFDVMVPTF